MEVKIPQKVGVIIDSFTNAGFEIYIVGGAVRDILTGKIVYDWDFTTNATPEQMLELFPDAFYDNKFGTVGIPPEKEGERPFEITTFRSEYGYSDARHPDKVNWGKTLEEDLKRRDFTINAMALKIRNETASKDRQTGTLSRDAELIDPFDGQKDLKEKVIRAVGDPNQRFSEDALRMLRAVRIAAELGFSIEENTLKAIQENVKLINKISRERVRDELFKIIASPFAYEGMLLLRNVGLMQEVLPELAAAFGVEQKSPGRHHIYDVGTHSLLSLKFCPSKDTIVRLATLLHDIGKVKTFKKLASGTITFYNHEIVGANLVKKISKRLKLSNKQSDKLWRLVRYHQFSVDERQTDSAIRRFIRKVGLENVPDVLDLRVGDRLGGGARETSWRLEEFKKRLIEVQKQPFTVHDLKIDGYEVMKILNIPPGPKVGEVLQKLFEEVVEKKLPNEKKALLARLEEFK